MSVEEIQFHMETTVLCNKIHTDSLLTWES